VSLQLLARQQARFTVLQMPRVENIAFLKEAAAQ
jgi:hypothetical protein